MSDATLSSSVLPAVIALVQEVGGRLADEFGRAEGPRARDADTAPIDTEIELFLRERLTTLLPARFVGEEAGVLAAEANGYCWVVDPHDGTRAFLEGRRGSAISVGLLRNGEPVLGVVYAPTSPDRGPDLIAWAEGAPISRNGVVVRTDLRPLDLTASDVVFLNHGSGERPVWNGTACAPARFLPLPSIAYRLARVAAGDGIATITLRPVGAHDIAAGHALLKAAGGVLIRENGEPVRYDADGNCEPAACFGGAPRAVATLRMRTWRRSTEVRRAPRVTLTWPRPAEDQRLDRAFGCMLGMVVGDSLGAQVEFKTAQQIRPLYPSGVREMLPSPIWHTLAGQPTDDSELGLALARAIVTTGVYHAEAAATAYGRWYASDPFDCGNTTRAAFSPAAGTLGGKAFAARRHADPTSQANGALARVAPIGVWARDAEEAARVAAEDTALSHPNPVCQASSAVLAAAISAGIAGADRAGMMAVGFRTAERFAVHDVIAALEKASAGALPPDYHTQMGWVLIALQNAFYHLKAGVSVETALIETISQGGDTDTNASIAGALLGAADGRMALPIRWVLPVLTCRPEEGLNAEQPRPDEYWPDDLLDLTEALLLRRAPS